MLEQRSDLELMGIFVKFLHNKGTNLELSFPQVCKETLEQSQLIWEVSVSTYSHHEVVDLQQGMGILQIPFFQCLLLTMTPICYLNCSKYTVHMWFFGSCGSVNLFQHVTGLSNIDANRYWMILSKSCLVTFNFRSLN